MSYWLTLFVLILAGFLLTELIQRMFFKRKVNVVITDKDGSKRVVTIVTGKDPEVERLLQKARKNRQVA